MKILKSNQSVNPFGGINLVYQLLDQYQIEQCFEKWLPELPNQSQYSWKDILYNFWSIYLCGGDCIEDLAGNFGHYLSNHPLIKKPSPDSVLRRFKSIAVPALKMRPNRGNKEHLFAINQHLADLNLSLLKQLKCSFDDVLDYDNTICQTNKKDSRLTYLRNFGYSPGVALMGSKVVYIENRSGNSPAHILQEDTLQRMFNHLAKHDITPSVFRADSASFQLQTIRVVEQHCQRFYIKSRMNQAIARAIQSVEKWGQVFEGSETLLRADAIIPLFEGTLKRNRQEAEIKNYRLIITKVPRRDQQIELFTGEAYIYSVICTNDFTSSPDEIVQFYNQRGKTEREFDVLKNDFGWKKLPFSYMDQNLVYLFMTAIARNIYHHLINHFSQQHKGLKITDRVKKFIFRFICIPAKWVKSSRTWKLKIYSPIPY